MARKESLQGTITTRRSITDRHSGLSRDSAKFNTCLLHVVVSNGRGLHSTPLKRSKDPLEYHSVLLCFTISRLRGISTTWSLSPLHFDVHKEARSKGGMSNAHKTQNQSTIRTQVTTRALNTTQRVLYSNGALVAITKNQMCGIEVLVLRNA